MHGVGSWVVLGVHGGGDVVMWWGVHKYNDFKYQINTVLCLIKVNSHTIKFTVYTSRDCV